MHYRLYIDSLFFLNFIFDLMLLHCLRKMLKCTATHLSVIIAAVFGSGAVCIVMIMPYIGLLPKLVIMYFFVSAGMIKIAFRKIGVKGLLKALFLLYCMSFVIGGSIQWAAANIPWVQKDGLQMIEVIGIGYAAFLLLQYAYRKWKERKSDFVSVTLYQNGKAVTVKALVDTGNGLVEPVSGKPVSVIAKSCMEGTKFGEDNTAYCIIPYHSIGRAHGVLEGIRIPRMVITTDEGRIAIDNTVIALSEEAVSQTGSYQMILNPKLLED